MPLVITEERRKLDLNLPKIKQAKQSVPKKTETQQVKRFAPEKNQFLTGPIENKFELTRADKYMYTRGSAAEKRIKRKVDALKRKDRVKRIPQ
jgi:hypothetical protein